MVVRSLGGECLVRSACRDGPSIPTPWHPYQTFPQRWMNSQPAGLAVIFPYHQPLLLPLRHPSHSARSQPASRSLPAGVWDCRRVDEANWASFIWETRARLCAVAFVELYITARHRRRQQLHRHHHHHPHQRLCVCVCVRAWLKSEPRNWFIFREFSASAEPHIDVFRRLSDS